MSWFLELFCHFLHIIMIISPCLIAILICNNDMKVTSKLQKEHTIYTEHPTHYPLRLYIINVP